MLKLTCIAASRVLAPTERRFRVVVVTLCALLAVPFASRAQQHDPNVRHQVTLEGDEPQLGPSDALVTVVEFGGFQDPFSARVAPTLKQLSKQYPKDLRIVWLNNPLPFHRDGLGAANAALEAHAQQGNKGFWAMHDKLMANQSALDRSSLEARANELGLDTARFNKALDTGAHASTIQRQQALARTVGAQGTPNFFINGRNSVRGAVPLEAFVAAVDEELAHAKSLVEKGTPRAKVYAAALASDPAESAAAATAPQGATRPAGVAAKDAAASTKSGADDAGDLPSPAEPIRLDSNTEALLTSLPTPSEAYGPYRHGLDAPSTLAYQIKERQQIAAMWALMDYIAVVTKLPLEKLRGVPQWQEYDRTQKSFRESAKERVKFEPVYESKEFRREVIGRLPPSHQQAYWAMRAKKDPLPPGTVDPTTIPPPAPMVTLAIDDGRYDAQKRRLRAAGIDLEVFGVTLYEPLSLPQCPGGKEEMTAFGILFGVAIGSEETCVGDTVVTKVMGVSSVLLKGLGQESVAVKQVPVTIGDSDCPAWVRLSGMCVVLAKVLDGYVIGANVPVAAGQVNPVSKYLSKKFKRKPKVLDSGMECVDDWGRVVYSFNDRKWRVQGLHITYLPVVPTHDCLRNSRGAFKVETPEYRTLLSE